MAAMIYPKTPEERQAAKDRISDEELLGDVGGLKFDELGTLEHSTMTSTNLTRLSAQHNREDLARAEIRASTEVMAEVYKELDRLRAKGVNNVTMHYNIQVVFVKD